MGKIKLREVDKVEIVTLQDNYIDITAVDNSDIISRAKYLANGEIKNSIQAEHGFSTVITTVVGDETKTMLFDFGFSESGAAYNAKILDVPMEKVEIMALSHGHSDHAGGIEKLVNMIGKKSIGLVVHPSAFKHPRYLKFGSTFKAYFPEVARDRIEKAGVKLIETVDPYLLLDDSVLFLGEIERKTDFEKGMPNAYCVKDGVESWDPIEDDSSIIINLRGKGLVVLSGCCHSGIINTVNYAKAVTGINEIHVIMGGFHLSGPLFEQIIDKTIEELKKINPTYIVPCHCTGRNAIMNIEREMPGQFLLNMSGTKLTF